MLNTNKWYLAWLWYEYIWKELWFQTESENRARLLQRNIRQIKVLPHTTKITKE